MRITSSRNRQTKLTKSLRLALLTLKCWLVHVSFTALSHVLLQLLRTGHSKIKAKREMSQNTCRKDAKVPFKHV